MATLSGKLADVTLPIDHFEKHLDSQGKVTNSELAAQNFQYAGEILCDLWSCDSIFRKYVDTQYVGTFTNLFENLHFEGMEKEKAEELKRQEKQKQKNVKKKNEKLALSESFVPWSWIERHCNLCTYSLDIKRCKDMSCCESPKANEAIDFLESYNSFLPPITKAKDGHFTNPIHLLQYYDLLKIPGYDAYCPSLEKDTYLRLCCPICQKYFPTLTFLTNHRKTAYPTTRG